MRDVSIIYQIFKDTKRDDELPFVYMSLDKAINFCASKSNAESTYFTRPSYLDETNYVDGNPVFIVAEITSDYEIKFPIIYCDKALADQYVETHPLKDAFYIVTQSVLVK